MVSENCGPWHTCCVNKKADKRGLNHFAAQFGGDLEWLRERIARNMESWYELLPLPCLRRWSYNLRQYLFEHDLGVVVHLPIDTKIELWKGIGLIAKPRYKLPQIPFLDGSCPTICVRICLVEATA